ncbi:hypothetical protein CI610_03583 [invertebrate metagenome]|uniref:Uncharacterized protein n=1 Tax=invertebrate metagenome TaxID=1711999 RepID=A0A2H9T2P4_9ZZZZ
MRRNRVEPASTHLSRRVWKTLSSREAQQRHLQVLVS